MKEEDIPLQIKKVKDRMRRLTDDMEIRYKNASHDIK